MDTEKLPLVFKFSGYHVPNARGEAKLGNINHHDIQSTHVKNVQKMKYLEESVFKYDMRDVINIPKLKDSQSEKMKNKCKLNYWKSMIGHWTKEDISTLKDYQQNTKQFSTNGGVSSNWLRYLLQNLLTEELVSNIDETYVPMAYEGYFGGCLYLKITLDVMLCTTKKVVQALHDSIKNFGRSGIAGELGETTTIIVNLLLVVCAKLSDISNLPPKAKCTRLKFFQALNI